jgi:hypothetical protein
VYQAVLRSPTDYGKTQELGGDLRNSDVYAFEYVSARDAEAGLNVAILDPCCFESPYKATDLHPWSCITTAESVTFMRLSKKRIEEFSLAQFLVNGEFPMPPN